MMRRYWTYITDTRRLTIIGLVAMAALFFLGAEVLELALIWAIAATVLMLLIAGAVWWWRRRRAGRDAELLAQAITAPAPSDTVQRDQSADEVRAIREGLFKAIDTIKGSRLGIISGTRALYELPWYLIIGNPAAGKSTAVTNSGLQFPFADGKVVQGVAGTRNCDWFFTPDGILLDTAGRYSVMDEHRAEWFGFLDLLKKYRRRAPINGILIAVSIAELRGDDPEAGIKLARSLRKRVQDLIERLEVFAPVYVVFTKADLIAGFGEFFAQAERAERERVWGATMPYQRKNASQQILAFFDQTFDELCDGLKALSIANMGQQRRDRMEPGVFTFPLEFSTLRAPLRAFLATLFEENPFQFKPLFRGYYFTSALQEGLPVSAQARRVAQRFALTAPQRPDRPSATGHSGFFLFNLFRNVIFADKDLVSQYASRHKVRLMYGMFFAAVLVLGAALGGWSWSYLGNRQLVGNVQADLDQVIKLQQGRMDLQARLEALAILQDRIEQLERYRDERPWSLRMGLYQGELLEQKLRAEYFAGVKAVMVKPVVDNLEELLAATNAHAGQLHAPGAPAAAGADVTVSTDAAGAQFQQASAVNVEDAYNALKTYLMLADKTHAEPGHLNDQLTRYWRGWLESQRGAMSREQMIQSAERLMTYYLAQVADPAWPRIEPKLALVDQSRETLRRVVRGMPARERVYADIRARANTRFPAMTVARMVGEQDQALVTGSHAIAGAYTREAWEKYVQPAFREAAARELQSTDWVLKSATRDDLTLEGSPEQIQKGLTDLYKADYAREWQKFVTGVTIGNLNGFDAAVVAMNRLGDPQSSPLARLLATIHEQTSWDNPSVMSAELKAAQTGFVNWIKNNVLRRGPAQVNVNLQLPGGADQPMGPVGREFAGVGRLLAARDKEASLFGTYLQTLSKLRGRLNQLKNQGDPGPGARQFMQQTLEGTGSELADALRYVDEQMLNGMSDSQKQAIRPLLVRPLMQTFAVLIGPAEAEINKTWLAQVYEPFRQTLADKYPFAPNGRSEAASADIARFFGPDGLIAKFATTAMGPLVVRRGDVLSPRTWADMGITLAPQTVTRFAGWIAPLGGDGASAGTAAPQTVFQIQPLPAPGALEYTVDIDGQQLRYRNTPPQWANMVHPGPTGAEGARIAAVGPDGRTVEVFNEPGPQGLKKMIDAATKQRRDGGGFELRWTSGALTVAMGLKIISSPDSGGDTAAAAPAPGQGFRGMQLPETVVGASTSASASAPAGAPVPALAAAAAGAAP